MAELQKIPATQMAVLELLSQSKTPVTLPEIEAAIGGKFPVKGAVSNMVVLKRIKSKAIPDSKYVGYVLTPTGTAILKQKDKLHISPYVPKQSASRKYKTKKGTGAASDVLPAFAPTMNVSASADNLMDHISAVIQENSGYREAILKSCQQLAALLGMQVVPITENEQE